jgi:hypothetical protein
MIDLLFAIQLLIIRSFATRDSGRIKSAEMPIGH